ncbi:MAG: phosphopantothenoylcysteine decarboxylase [Planctomycetaceae bacterium]|nr:phosphopantothenoylcysteine decarboxylase [Planctomycetaceae bacterium]
MPRILITAGPTREYLDPVRYLSNASSGKMGAALAKAALNAGFEVTIVSGPVGCHYPQELRVIRVTTTDEMLQACLQVFPDCVGAIGAAAPCDFRPKAVSVEKIKKTGDDTMTVEFVATPDIFAELGKIKQPNQWLVPFALETCENGKEHALEKLRQKNGDWIILNGPKTILGGYAEVEILDRTGTTLATLSGTKESVATQIIGTINAELRMQYAE